MIEDSGTNISYWWAKEDKRVVELEKQSTCKDFLQVQKEGKREVKKLLSKNNNNE